MTRISVRISQADLRAMCGRLRPEAATPTTVDMACYFKGVGGVTAYVDGYGVVVDLGYRGGNGRSEASLTAQHLPALLAYHDALVAELRALGEAQGSAPDDRPDDDPDDERDPADPDDGPPARG